MARPLTGDEPLNQRLHLMLAPSDLQSIDDFRFTERVGSRSEAIRRLIELGLEAHAAGWTPEVDSVQVNE